MEKDTKVLSVVESKDIKKDFFSPRFFSGDTGEIVTGILSQVREKGDAVLREYAATFDKCSLTGFCVDGEDIRLQGEALKKDNPALYEALAYSWDLALRFARRQRKSFEDFETELEPGLFTGQKTIAVDRAGLYVPAGRFPLLSTVIMTAAPAVAAGCKEVILCTPPRKHPSLEGKPFADKGILATAHICGISKIFACGGAQAIGAMAYGTETIPRCDVIVGPGNKYVAEAKRLVYGTVGIDMVAGPTEVFIIADKTAHPAWVAADMLAQSEHDPDAQAILATDSRELACAVEKELEKQLEVLPTKEVAAVSLKKNGYIIITKDLDEAADLANKKAPEHLELALEAGATLDALRETVHNYGSLFIGHGSAEVLGDYAAGLNHTLPTSTSARFTGGLSVRNFLKTVTTLRTEEGSAGQKKSALSASVLGEAEGLIGHARAAQVRL